MSYAVISFKAGECFTLVQAPGATACIHSCSWLNSSVSGNQTVKHTCLLYCRSVAAAGHPIHQLQRLAQVDTLVHKLDQHEATAPAVARYLVSLLLQLMRTPALQSNCCFLLEVLFQLLYQAASAADQAAPPAAAGKGASKEEKAAAKAAHEQQQQQQQLAVALLEQLLPPAVATLVQCVERAAAAKQLQQQQELWASTSSTGAGMSALTAALDLPSNLPPVRTLLTLLQKPPRALLRVVQTLDLLPPLPVLAAPVALQQKLQQGVKLTHRVVQFADRAAGMAGSSRLRVIQAITAQLQGNVEDIYVGGVERHSQEAAAGSGAAEGEGSASSSRRASSAGERNQSKEDSRVDEQQGLGKNRPPAAAAGCNAGVNNMVVDPAVVAAAFKIAKLGAQLGDKGVTELSGHLLALAGPLDPNIITFDAAAGAAGSCCNGGGSDAESRAQLEECTAFPMQAVLQHLVDCMFHHKPHVVAVAQQTLAHLMKTSKAAAVLQSLHQAGQGRGSDVSSTAASDSALLSSYLSVYAVAADPSQSASQREVDQTAAVQALSAVVSADLWSPVGKTYGSWLCGLCSAVLTACATAGSTLNEAGSTAGDTPVGLLQLLADAAALQPQLAELLLPHALLALCSSDGSGAEIPGIASTGLSAKLGACITEGLQLGSSSSNSGVQGAASLFNASDSSGSSGNGTYVGSSIDVRCLSVLLSCLEHNRLVHRAAYLAMPGSSQPPPAVSWQRCYCLHINYLDVAAAAMACKAYFTALRYIEHWCEEQYGRLTLNPAGGSGTYGGVQLLQLQQLQQLAGLDGSSSGAGGTGSVAVDQAQRQQQDLLERMLLDLYSNVNEPDGIYAVAAAFSSTSSQLHLLQHEQQWASVLGAEDALLQGSAVQAHKSHNNSAGEELNIACTATDTADGRTVALTFCFSGCPVAVEHMQRGGGAQQHI